MSVKLYKFGESETFSLEKLNENTIRLAAQINALAGSQLLDVGGATGNDGSGYAPLIGANFLGQITAPSVLVGPSSARKPVVTEGSLATTTKAGIVKAATAVADLAQDVSATPTEAEVQLISDKVDALLGALRTAGLMDV